MHMLRVVAFAQEMIIIRVELHLKLLVSFYQRADILHRMLHMHIIVCRTMNDKHVTRQVCRFIDER